MFNDLYMESVITIYGTTTLSREQTAKEAVRSDKEEVRAHSPQRDSVEYSNRSQEQMSLIQVQLCKGQAQMN